MWNIIYMLVSHFRKVVVSLMKEQFRILGSMLLIWLNLGDLFHALFWQACVVWLWASLSAEMLEG